MSATPPDFTPPPQHWPCGPDCIYAQPQVNTFGEWVWCERPGARERLVRAGRECTCFRAAAYQGERPPPLPPPSAG